MSQSENSVVRSCMKYLSVKGWSVWRIHNRAVKRTDLRNAPWVFHGSMGLPDILSVKKGFPALAVECKSENGRQSQWQVQFESAWMAAGHVYIVARSIDDLIDAGI